ncbi:MAG TPA: NADH-quinone oxidoreductase subunit L [Verrucomicrobiae bacterium]|nr:NADH-quinone oxidoreductase subunit L [Verrucomicrobiae bacterium]
MNPDSFHPEHLAWPILFLPLLAAFVIGLGTRRDGRLSARLSITAVVVSFVLSVGLFLLLGNTLEHNASVSTVAGDWLAIGDFKVELGLILDRLSLLMLLIVTGVGSAIHIYSYGYMKEDPALGRYFGGLSLFMFSMLGIVLANNLVLMFICWELVGVSSYLLIGFWYAKPAAADACKKAFLTNRLGDFGFILGIILVWATLGSVGFEELRTRLNTAPPEAWAGLAALAGLLLFCGAMGKSAQFPLHVWLPDAMEGPTPVSALIHAATMVAAGVYMLCRAFFLLGDQRVWPGPLSFLDGISALDIIAWIGGITALLAALIAVQQNDIKRILAYSTLSQLGYMVMAVGLQGPTAAMYHLSTHAFFKALLFLAAGSVIYACHHEQNIWRMGGLRAAMPITYRTFLVGTLALCGVPPFSGFFSKDAILAAASQHSAPLFMLGIAVAFLTAFYMARLLLVAFFDEARSDSAGHVHESPGVMTWPLVVLAVASTLAGFWALDGYLERQFEPGEPAGTGGFLEAMFAPFAHAPLAALCGLGATLFGLSFAYSLYRGAKQDPLPGRLGMLSRLMRDRFRFDELYDRLIAITHEALAALADCLDRWLIAGLFVRGLHGTVEILGRALRLAQTGNLQTYAFLFVAGVVVLIVLALK